MDILFGLIVLVILGFVLLLFELAGEVLIWIVVVSAVAAVLIHRVIKSF